MSWLVVAPILIPMGGAALCALAWGHHNTQRALAMLTGLGLLASSVLLIMAVLAQGTLVTAVGDWPAPYGISFVADTFGAIMVLLNGIIGFATLIYSLGGMDTPRKKNGFYPLTLALLASCSGAFLSADLFNIYVWFEIMLMSSFVLLTLGGERGQLEGAIKYVTLNLLSSSIFLSAVGLLYGLVGTLNLADIAVKLHTVDSPVLVTTIAMLFLVAFGIKAAVFPFFGWLPASYHTPPAAVSALFAGLLTKVGVYTMFRVFSLMFTQELELMGNILLVIAGLTMVTGVLGAAAQFEIRRVLSFHIVSQIGYMIMGPGIAFTALGAAEKLPAGSAEREALTAAAALAMTGAIFYILHHIIVKTNLFFVAGIIQHMRGTNELKYLGGLYKNHPALALGFMTPAMSLAGIPILSGFWAKLVLIKAGVDAESWWIVFTALVVSVLTLFSMTKIWTEAFWKADPGKLRGSPERPEMTNQRKREIGVMSSAVVLLALITLTIGFMAGPAYRLAERAAGEVLDRAGYVRSILGDDYLNERIMPEGISTLQDAMPIGSGRDLVVVTPEPAPRQADTVVETTAVDDAARDLAVEGQR